MKPLVLVDVDGVINALARGSGAWPDWQLGTARALHADWPIQWSPTVTTRIHGWLEVADVQWLTTWGHHANSGLAPLLGLPELPVAGTPQGGGRPDEGAVALASVTPAARDTLTGRWWKFDVVRELVGRDPDRPLIWVDDDLAHEDDLQDWVRSHTARCLLVTPNPLSGLVESELAAVEAFLRPAGPG